jgi:hypothetical protein
MARLGWENAMLGDRKTAAPLAHLLENAGASYAARREAALALGLLGGAESEAALSKAAAPRPAATEAARQGLAEQARQTKDLLNAGRRDELLSKRGEQ